MKRSEQAAIENALAIVDCLITERGDPNAPRYNPQEAGWRYKGDQAPPLENALAEARVWLQRALWRGKKEKA